MNHYFPPEDYDAIYSVEDFYASIKLVVANYYKVGIASTSSGTHIPSSSKLIVHS